MIVYSMGISLSGKNNQRNLRRNAMEELQPKPNLVGTTINVADNMLKHVSKEQLITETLKKIIRMYAADILKDTQNYTEILTAIDALKTNDVSLDATMRNTIITNYQSLNYPTCINISTYTSIREDALDLVLSATDKFTTEIIDRHYNQLLYLELNYRMLQSYYDTASYSVSKEDVAKDIRKLLQVDTEVIYQDELKLITDILDQLLHYNPDLQTTPITLEENNIQFIISSSKDNVYANIDCMYTHPEFSENIFTITRNNCTYLSTKYKYLTKHFDNGKTQTVSLTHTTSSTNPSYIFPLGTVKGLKQIIDSINPVTKTFDEILIELNNECTKIISEISTRMTEIFNEANKTPKSLTRLLVSYLGGIYFNSSIITLIRDFTVEEDSLDVVIKFYSKLYTINDGKLITQQFTVELIKDNPEVYIPDMVFALTQKLITLPNPDGHTEAVIHNIIVLSKVKDAILEQFNIFKDKEKIKHWLKNNLYI